MIETLDEEYMVPEQTINTISIVLSIVSIGIAVLSVFAAWLAAKYARQSVTTTILLELHKEYSSDEMNDAVRYIHELKEEHSAEFSDNPYRFARNYIKNIAIDSPEWKKRRMVSHFYNHLGNLIDRGLVNRKAVSSLWSEQDMAIIEILEPIETAICERDHLLPYPQEWLPLRLLNETHYWNKNHRRWWRRINPNFTLPRNTELYQASLVDSSIKSVENIPVNSGNSRKYTG